MSEIQLSQISVCSECIPLREAEKRIVELENKVRDLTERLNQNSSNSSSPPSSDAPWTPLSSSKQKTGRHPGGQPGHPGHFRKFLPIERVNKIVRHVPEVCERCGHPLSDGTWLENPLVRRHQVVELPLVAAEVIEHQGHSRICPVCAHVTEAQIPVEIRSHTLGPRLTAMLSFLMGYCHLSKRVVEEIVQTVFEVPISLGSIVNYQDEMSQALAPAYAQVEQVIQNAPSKNVDETGWSKKGNLCWLWLAATTDLALFKIHVRRGTEGLRALLGEVIKGIITSDRWSAYGKLMVEFRQICWAHLKRDFQKFLEFGGVRENFGEAGLYSIREVFKTWAKFKAGRISRVELKRAIEPIKEQLKQILEDGRAGPEQKVAKFSMQLLKLYPALWTFAFIEGVEPTNNHAERCLRPAVLWRKRSFGNQSDEGCRFSERILTVVQSLRLQKRRVFEYLVDAVQNYRLDQPTPSII